MLTSVTLALAISYLDYCNSLYKVLSQKLELVRIHLPACDWSKVVQPNKTNLLGIALVISRLLVPILDTGYHLLKSIVVVQAKSACQFCPTWKQRVKVHLLWQVKEEGDKESFFGLRSPLLWSSLWIWLLSCFLSEIRESSSFPTSIKGRDYNLAGNS